MKQIYKIFLTLICLIGSTSLLAQTKYIDYQCPKDKNGISAGVRVSENNGKFEIIGYVRYQNGSFLDQVDLQPKKTDKDDKANNKNEPLEAKIAEENKAIVDAFMPSLTLSKENTQLERVSFGIMIWRYTLDESGQAWLTYITDVSMHDVGNGRYENATKQQYSIENNKLYYNTEELGDIAGTEINITHTASDTGIKKTYTGAIASPVFTMHVSKEPVKLEAMNQ